jgi:long-chain acyl-CoA synthetase
MNYTSKDQPFARGEICFKGYNCFSGYYKLPEKTAEAIDKDGWVHTGDIGLIDSQGRVKIVDRKKNIFKLAQGEYIAPEKIENVYVNNEFVAQGNTNVSLILAFVYGDSLQATLVGVIVPDDQILKKWVDETQPELKGKSIQDLCKDDRVKKHILTEIQQHGKAHDLKGFENVKNIFLESELFSVENELLVTYLFKDNKIRHLHLKSNVSKLNKSIKSKLIPCMPKLTLQVVATNKRLISFLLCAS